MKRLLFSFFFLLIPLAAPAQQEEWGLARSQSRSAEAEPVEHIVKSITRHSNRGEYDLHLLLPKRGETRFQVIDLARPASPAAPRLSMRSVADGLRQAGALAGVNGGYFQINQAPLGLVIHDGRQEHPFQTTKLLTGVFIATPKGAHLLRSAEFRKGFQKGAYKGAPVLEALQAGPFLIDRGAVVPGLNATRPAERTILLADKRGVAALLVTPPITLAATAELLATPGLFPEVKIERALNLDGGSSTALWVAASGFSRSEWKRVRNALAIMPSRASSASEGGR